MMYTQRTAGIAVLEVASQFLDLREIENNTRWDIVATSDTLVPLLEATGWKLGWPYCMAFVEAVWGEAAKRVAPDAEPLLRQKFSPHVLTSYRNVKRAVHTRHPEPGAVFFMQKGQSANGHAGIVIMASRTRMVTIEANTSPGVVTGAADREGDGIYLKLRPIDFTPHATKLHLLGFLDPPVSIPELLATISP